MSFTALPPSTWLPVPTLTAVYVGHAVSIAAPLPGSEHLPRWRRDYARFFTNSSRRLPTEDSGDEIALLGGVDMLLEPRDLPTGEGPHVGNLHFGGLA